MCEAGCEGVKLTAKDLVAGWVLRPGTGPSLPWLKRSVHTARFSTTYRAPQCLDLSHPCWWNGPRPYFTGGDTETARSEGLLGSFDLRGRTRPNSGLGCSTANLSWRTVTLTSIFTLQARKKTSGEGSIL